MKMARLKTTQNQLRPGATTAATWVSPIRATGIVSSATAAPGNRRRDPGRARKGQDGAARPIAGWPCCSPWPSPWWPDRSCPRAPCPCPRSAEPARWTSTGSVHGSNPGSYRTTQPSTGTTSRTGTRPGGKAPQVSFFTVTVRANVVAWLADRWTASPPSRCRSCWGSPPAWHSCCWWA